MVGAAGLEPATVDLEKRCSILLSYTPFLKVQQLVVNAILPERI